jgi:hypothetical protein
VVANWCLTWSTAPPGSPPPVQKLPVGPATSRDECGAECAAGAGIFFPLGGRSVVTVKETADGRRLEGEQRVSPSEIGAQCATSRSAPSLTVIREGPPISVRPPRQGVPTFPFKRSRWGRHFERRVRSRVCGGCGIFPAGRQAGGDGEGKRRAGEDAGRVPQFLLPHRQRRTHCTSENPASGNAAACSPSVLPQPK